MLQFAHYQVFMRTDGRRSCTFGTSVPHFLQNLQKNLLLQVSGEIYNFVAQAASQKPGHGQCGWGRQTFLDESVYPR